MPPTLHIQLLGGFRLLAGDQLTVTIDRPRQQTLLAYLLLHRGEPQSRQQVAFCLWPDSTEAQAFTNLRKLFFELRRLLPQAEHFLFADNLSLGWRSDAPYTLDVAQVEHALTELDQAPVPAMATVERVVALYRGELLPGCYEDWILPVRRALHEQVINTLVKALVGLEAQAEYKVGLRCAEHLVRLDPLHEASYRHLMHLRALSGDRAGALRVYHECVRVLEQELGVPPAAETRAQYEHLLRTEPVATLAPPATQIPLVGRQREWQALQQAWREVGRGPRFVAVWGEAGVGKTRLVEELMHWVRLRPGSVAYARTYGAEGTLAYAPLTEWLRAEALRPAVAQAEKVWLTELVRLLPEVERKHPDLPAPLPMSEGWQRQRFHEALARVVLAAPQPVLLVLDDLQWCDGETLAWLRFLVRLDTQARLLVVGTVRSEAVDEQHPLHDLRRQLQREAQWLEVELAPLSREETAALARHLTGQDVAHWARQLYQETEGNPLFVVEMVRAGWIGAEVEEQARQQEGQTGEAAALPPTVQAVIAARLAQLSLPARQLAHLAATVGRVFTYEVLAAASDTDEQTLMQGLDELWRRRIVRERGPGYDFSHDKIREVAYAAIPPMQQRRLHQKVALALEQLYAADLAGVWDQLARHYEAAHLAARAVPYLMQMARQAEALDAYREASVHYARALALYTAQLATDLGGRFDVLFLRSALLERQGQVAQLAHDIETMLALAQSMADLDRLAQAHLRQASYLSATGDVAGAVAAGEQALSLYQSRHDQAGAIQALRELGLISWFAQDYGNALRYGRAVLQLHRQQSNLKGEATALHNLAEIYRSLQSPRQAIQLYEQALQLYALLRQDHRSQALTLYSLAYTLRQVAQPDQALHAYQQAQVYCERANDRLILSRVHHAIAILFWETQQPDAAVDAMRQAAEIARAIGHLPSMADSLLAQGYMLAHQDRREAAQHVLQEALTFLRQMGDEAGIREVEARLDLLAVGKTELPEPPATRNWIRSHVVLTEGKVYCEYELPTRSARNL